MLTVGKRLGRASGVGIVAILALCACSLMPRERATAPPIPAVWRDAPVAADVPLTNWWTQFNDATLDQLVSEALSNGPSVQLAALRVTEARAQAQSGIASNLPSLSAFGEGDYSRAIGHNHAGTEQMTGTYGPQASWEVPLFGRIQAAIAGARANVLSARADARGAQVALAADVVQAYIELRTAQNGYAALSQLTQSSSQLADILETSANAGIAAPADAANARRLAESTRAQLADLVIAQRRAENQLATLRGLSPGAEADAMKTALETVQQTPTLSLPGAPAAPADLIRLRPDVARAEAQTLLAAAALGDARANLLPQLNLTGMISTTRNIIGSPAASTTPVLSATPLITIPLFDWGALRAASRQRNAQFHESLITYKQTVTQAIAEASNALAALDQGQQRLQAARNAEAAAQRSDSGSQAAYSAGMQSLADRLQADQQLIDARVTRINAEQSEAEAAVSVFRAFGGGPSFAASPPRS
jgi:NodT family efflux transporter outer membrane factor (OMF) lipoprotein